jgi:putative transposase
MARPLRVEFENAIYHLCARGNARQAIFHDQHDCARFVRLLCESAQRFEAAVLCFVLMGNHFHLVAQSHRPNLQRWMHSLCGGFGRRELNRCARLGNFWRAGLCSGGPEDSPNTAGVRYANSAQASQGNVKC